MLDELKNLKYQGGKEELLFFICDVIGNNQLRLSDAEVICAHAQGMHYISVDNVIQYCHAFGWINIVEDMLSVSTSILSVLDDKEKLNDALIVTEISRLFDSEVFNSNMFSYDSVQCQYSFKNELLPLSLSTVRNILISQGFFFTIREPQGTRFYISPKYDNLIAKHCKTKRRQLSLERLKQQIENNEIAGEKAELFVLEYEKKRLGQPKCNLVKRISEIDVSAGYDIVSFNSVCSDVPDRYIEVKAVSKSGFYWSRNEYEVAKLFGENYFIYLVSLGHIDEVGYKPEIIANPAGSIMESSGWIVEPQSYHVFKLP